MVKMGKFNRQLNWSFLLQVACREWNGGKTPCVNIPHVKLEIPIEIICFVFIRLVMFTWRSVRAFGRSFVYLTDTNIWKKMFQFGKYKTPIFLWLFSCLILFDKKFNLKYRKISHFGNRSIRFFFFQFENLSQLEKNLFFQWF